jgi:tRNA A37 threonylcarbamoyladenosine dehydratase
MASSNHVNPDSDFPVLFRAADPELRELLGLVFSRYPDDEWATFIRCGWRATADSLVLTLASVDVPGEGDLDPSVGHVAFQEPYTLRTALAAEQHTLAVGVVHSHPAGYYPQPSTIDDDMDAYYAEYFADFAPGRPYVSLIVAKHGDELVLSGRIHWQGKWHYVHRAMLARQPVSTWAAGRRPPVRSAPRQRTARLSTAFGDVADARLQAATVAVIGAGGTGSAAIETLARVGIGSLVIVDPDVIEITNLERVHGSTEKDVLKKRSKVDVAARHVRSIAPECKVRGIFGRLPQAEAIDAVLEADVVLGCTDSQHSRLALSDIALRFLVPAIDCGVSLEGGAGSITGQIVQLTRFLPADACALCRRMILQRRLDQELMSPEDRRLRQLEAADDLEEGKENPYWQAEPQINTVGYHTTMAGAMVAGYAIGWITGRFDPPFGKLQMNLVAPLLEVVEAEYSPRPECSCRKVRGWADQGGMHALIAAPMHWPPVEVVGS